jgi:glycoside/pentoside/hexuronide:cation symporter, GPH family
LNDCNILNLAIAGNYRESILKKLNFWTKFSYGSGDLSSAVTTNILSFFLLFFFTNVAGLDAAAAGMILLIGKVWDAVNDPIVGILSDRTKSKWGRRLPWMLYGAIPFGVSFLAQWLVPTTDKLVLFWFYVAIAIIFNTFFTMVNLPYTALTAELTNDYEERTSLNGFRFTFSIGGSILSLLLAQVIFAWLKPIQGSDCTSNSGSLPYLVLAGICGLISIISIYGCVYGIRDRVLQVESEREVEVSEPMTWIEQFKIVIDNRPFLYVIGIYFCSWLAIQTTASIVPYFVIDWMGLEEKDFIQVTLAIQVTALVMLFVWGAIAQRVGKKAVYFMGVGIWLIAQTGLFLLQPGQIGLMYFLAVLAGFGVAVAYLIPWSMVPDVIELDELRTGKRREGIFYAFMVLLQKVGLAMGLFILGQALSSSGFLERVTCQPSPIQPQSALLAIRVAIGPLPAIILLLSLVLAYFYPISKQYHAEILQRLADRKAGINNNGND